MMIFIVRSVINTPCLKCKREYDKCNICHNKLCFCTKNTTKYDYGGNLYYCSKCYEEIDPLTKLYKYFKDKYNIF